MNAISRPTTANLSATSQPASSQKSARNYIAGFQNNTGRVDTDRLIPSARKDLEQGKIDDAFVKELDNQLKDKAHPFDLALFRDAFKSELNIQDTLTYQGRPIAVGSGIDRSQQTPEIATDTLFRHTNERGAIEVTDKFAFIAPPTQEAGKQVSANTQPNTECANPYEKLASLEWGIEVGKKTFGIEPPEAKLNIRDGSTPEDPRTFEIGEKGSIGDVTIQLTGHAENQLDSGSIHLNEKGALVTSFGFSGRSGLGLASAENQDKTAKGEFGVFDTEFEVSTEAHSNPETGLPIGTKTSAEVNLSLLRLDGEFEKETSFFGKEYLFKANGDIQAGPGVSMEVNTGKLKEKSLVDIAASIARGNFQIEVETRKPGCD